MNKPSNPTARKSYKDLVAAVAVTTATFGLSYVQVQRDGQQYYSVRYSWKPDGMRICTESTKGANAALYWFEKCLIEHLLR